MSQLQEQVLNRIKQDIEIKTNSEDENLLNTRLQQSVEELNVKKISIQKFIPFFLSLSQL